MICARTVWRVFNQLLDIFSGVTLALVYVNQRKATYFKREGLVRTNRIMTVTKSLLSVCFGASYVKIIIVLVYLPLLQMMIFFV